MLLLMVRENHGDKATFHLDAAMTSDRSYRLCIVYYSISMCNICDHSYGYGIFLLRFPYRRALEEKA